MRVDVLTLFPEMFRGPFGESIVRRAIQAGLLTLNFVDIREFTLDRHHSADDYPFGGGAGLVLKPQPIVDAIENAVAAARRDNVGRSTILVMAAQGRRFEQPLAEKLAGDEHLIVVCGHYEGIDARVAETCPVIELSIGDYVLTGGEIAAMVVVDAVARLIPGVLGAPESLAEESISSGLLEYPQYTRPAEYRGSSVPPVLLAGDHAAVARWRRDESLRRTFVERPDLLAHAKLTRADAATLSSFVDLPRDL